MCSFSSRCAAFLPDVQLFFQMCYFLLLFALLEVEIKYYMLNILDQSSKLDDFRCAAYFDMQLILMCSFSSYLFHVLHFIYMSTFILPAALLILFRGLKNTTCSIFRNKLVNLIILDVQFLFQMSQFFLLICYFLFINCPTKILLVMIYS